MQSRVWLLSLLAVLLGALALAGCGANPPAQAQPGIQAGIVLPTPPPMPTSQPRPPTPTPPPAPAALAPAAGATLLAADFGPATDLKQWKVIDAADALPGPSVWKLQNGHLVPYSDAQDLPSMYSTALVAGDPAWTDYSVSVAGYVTANDELGVVARAGDAGYYVFKLLPAAQQPGMLLARYDAAKGTFTPLATAKSGGYKERAWYTLRLVVQGETLTAYVNGQAALSARDATLKSGRAGVAAYAEGGLEFANFTVQALAPGSK